MEAKPREQGRSALEDTQILSLGQVGKHLQLHSNTVLRLIHSKALVATRIGGQWRVLVKDLNAYIMGNRTVNQKGQ